MEIHVSDILWPESIQQNTVNGWVYLRPEFIYFIYFLAILLIGLSAYILKRKYALMDALKRAVLLSMVCTALLYSAAYEFVWSRWLLADVSMFYGKNGDEKQVALNGDFFRFIAQCKHYIGNDGYSLFPEATSTDELHSKFTRLQYYLLPARRKAEADNLIVLSDGNVRFDQVSGTLYAGDRIINNVKPGYMTSPDEYLLKVGK